MWEEIVQPSPENNVPNYPVHRRMFLADASAPPLSAGIPFIGPRYFRRGRETRRVLVALQIGYGGRETTDLRVSEQKNKKSVAASRQNPTSVRRAQIVSLEWK